MDSLKLLNLVKQTAIAGVFSDDRLLEELVLKGGNALDIVYGISTRASVDIDFSMGGDFESHSSLRERIERGLQKSFGDIGLVVFDVTLVEVPMGLSDDLKDFWGGYRAEFKIATTQDFQKHAANLENLRRHAQVIGESTSTKFRIDISKHEFLEDKKTAVIKGLTMQVYSPAMIVCEKIRALCQQMPEYAFIVKRTGRPGTARARDFVDICTIFDNFAIDVSTPEFRRTLQRVFQVKRVPLNLIANLRAMREFHRSDFTSVKATVKAGVALREFDDYFDFVIRLCEPLKSLGEEDSPA